MAFFLFRKRSVTQKPFEIYSILPELLDESGHIYSYNCSVKEAVEANAWHHRGWVPANCQIVSLPEGWSRVLPKAQVKGIFRYFLSCFGLLRQIPSHVSPVLFLEHFRLFHIVALFLALSFQRRPFQIWLLHRYAPSQMVLEGRLHAWFYRLFRKHRLRFLTDSELLAQQQSQRFGKPVQLVPIPHAQLTTQESFVKEPGTLYCWWPGAPRPAKGWAQILRLSAQISQVQGTPLRLVVARSALSDGVVPSPSLVLVEEGMSRDAYEKWMHTADVILLPYDPAVYHSGTSGIFVEAVVAGKVPLVRAGTWMAHELCQHNLEALILDWDEPTLVQHIIALAHDPAICAKLQRMQAAYQQFHSIETYAKILNQLLVR